MTTLTQLDIDTDHLPPGVGPDFCDSPTQRRVREWVVPETDEEPTAEDRREAGRRLAGNPDDKE